MTVMSFSKKDREENKNAALRKMLAAVGDQRYFQVRLDPQNPEFSDVYQTTWADLKDQGLIERYSANRGMGYSLSGAGWIEALSTAGEFDKKAFQERVGKLAATLKGYVKGREKDEDKQFSEVVGDSGLPPGWVFNAIDSNLLELRHGRKGVRWLTGPGGRGRFIRIPLNFGLD